MAAVARPMSAEPVLWAAVAGTVGTIIAAIVGYFTAYASTRQSAREGQLQRYDSGLWETIKVLRSDIAALREEMEERDRRIEALSSIIDTLRNQLIETRGDLAQVRLSERSLRRENEQLRKRVSELEAASPRNVEQA